MNIAFLRILMLTLLLGLGANLLAQETQTRPHPYYTTEARLRIGRVLAAEMTTGDGNGAKPHINNFSNLPAEQKLKLGNAEVIGNLTKPAYVAVTFVPDVGRSLSIYDYELECFGKYYRCVGLMENGTTQNIQFKPMVENRAYTMYFVIEYPGYTSGELVPMTLEWKLDASGKERSVIDIVNCKDEPLTSAVEIAKHRDDYRRFLAGDKGPVLPSPSQAIRFGNARGNDVLDIRNQRAGLLVNNARLINGGLNGKCLDLTNGYVQINPNVISYGRANLGTAFTFAIWLKMPADVVNDEAYIYTHGPKGEGKNTFTVKLKGGMLIVKVHGEKVVADARALSVPANFVADGSWHQVVMTHTPEQQILYLDGEQRAKRALNKEGFMSPSEPVIIGLDAGRDQSTRYRGNIDQFVVYDATLSAAEVEALYKKRGK